MNDVKKPPTGVPNPEAWCDRSIAATLLRVSERTVARMGADGRLHEYLIGTCPLYWRDDVNGLAAARRAAGIGSDI